MKWYSTAELAEAMHCSERQIGKLRKHGLLVGIRSSHGWVFHELEVERFWQTYRGCDLSNEDKMQLAYALKNGTAPNIRPRRRSS